MYNVLKKNKAPKVIDYLKMMNIDEIIKSLDLQENKETGELTIVQIQKKDGSTKDVVKVREEGAETEVLKNFPFSKYKFLALTIERPTKRLNKILFKNGYVFVKNHKVDSFYVHENLKNLSRIEKKPFSQIGRKKW